MLGARLGARLFTLVDGLLFQSYSDAVGDDVGEAVPAVPLLEDMEVCLIGGVLSVGFVIGAVVAAAGGVGAEVFATAAAAMI